MTPSPLFSLPPPPLLLHLNVQEKMQPASRTLEQNSAHVPTSEPTPLPGVVGADGRDGPSPLLLLSAGRVGRLGAWGSAIARGTVRQHGALCRLLRRVSPFHNIQRFRQEAPVAALCWCHAQVSSNTVHVPHLRHLLAAVCKDFHLC